jgi:hypothetical protein
MRRKIHVPSFPLERASSGRCGDSFLDGRAYWVPAFAGMTGKVCKAE